MEEREKVQGSVIGGVSSYIAKSGEAEIPAEVMRKAKHHILDSIAASASGSKLKPGILRSVRLAPIGYGWVGFSSRSLLLCHRPGPWYASYYVIDGTIQIY